MPASCFVCGNQKLAPILRQRPIPLWSGAGDRRSRAPRLPCRLFQCVGCGHVQQPVGSALTKQLARMYRSGSAQVSTEFGRGNWGGQRASMILGLLQKLQLAKRASVLEIGCANGYLLRALRARGSKELVGIDPSCSPGRKGGIEYIRAAVPAASDLGRTFELVLALCSFEHMIRIHEALSWVRRHLAKQGALFFEVPSVERWLACGDPAVFTHEHIHYFTPGSVRVLLSSHGMAVKTLLVIGDSMFVCAGLGKPSGRVVQRAPTFFSGYQQKVASAIKRIAAESARPPIAFHGACNALNNILGWVNVSVPFGLFDNDEVKIGKRYFGVTVQQPTKANIRRYRSIIVAPSVYFPKIRQQYRRLGFAGSVIAPVKG